MDTFPSGKIKILEAKNKDLDLAIFVKDLDRLTKNRKINMNVLARLSILPRDSSLRSLNNSQELERPSESGSLPIFYENGDYEVFISLNQPYSSWELVQNGMDISSDFTDIEGKLFGSLSFRSDVGYTDLRILIDSQMVLQLDIEVFPSKMDYLKDYNNMIMDINHEIASMAFQLWNKTYLPVSLRDTRLQTGAEFVNILDYIFKDFLRSLSFIVNNFKHNIIDSHREVASHRARRVSKRSLNLVRKNPQFLWEDQEGFLRIGDRSYSSERVVEVHKVNSRDIYENRMVKFILRDIIKRLELIRKQLLSREEAYFNTIDTRYGLDDKIHTLKGRLRRHFSDISDINYRSSMSLVFKMAPGYRDFYKKYIMLGKGLDLGRELLDISPKKIYELYEIWSYIKLHQILGQLGYRLEDYGIFSVRDNGLHLNLGREGEASMTYSKENQKIRLWYNKSYSLPTTQQRPDTVLYIQNLNSQSQRTYIFDAKYRMYIDGQGNENPIEEDINVMHRYRDAIVSKLSHSFRYKYDTFGAYVMFPCSDEDSFRENKYYKSIDEVNIGALPMLPGSSNLMKRHLENILEQSDLEAKEDRLTVDEYDDFYRFKLENVMIGSVPDRKHLEAYLDHEFYHIPKKEVSNRRFGVRYIAFYQPKTGFPDEDSGIFYYGEIASMEEYTRDECRELASDKEEVYIRFNLKNLTRTSRVVPLQISPRPIMYTSLYLLENASNMHEIKIESPLEMRVHKLLYKFARKDSLKVSKQGGYYQLGEEKIEILNGREISYNGKIIGLEELKASLGKKF